MVNGDVLTTLDFRVLVHAHEQAGNALTIATHRRIVDTDYGVLQTEGPLQGLLARAVVVLDEQGKVLHSQLVDEITTEPDYDAAVAALN